MKTTRSLRQLNLFVLLLLTGSTALAELPGGVRGGQFAKIVVPATEFLDSEDPNGARERLSLMGVKYLWRMVDEDIVPTGGGLVVRDFMLNGDAVSSANVAKLTCKSKKEPESFLFVGRPAPDDFNGGLLKVKEKDPRVSRLEATDSFTVGAWVKLMPVSLRDETSPHNLPRGFMPLLTRSSSRTHEWIAQLTTERLYMNVDRGVTGQNDMNQQLPWWAHTYGTCWNGRYSEECWHFVAVSVDPAKNKAQFVIVRREGNNLPGHTEDFSQLLETDKVLNKMSIPTRGAAELLIGGDGGASVHGLLRGVFFARSALTKEQMKSIANFTAPTRRGVMCYASDLFP